MNFLLIAVIVPMFSFGGHLHVKNFKWLQNLKKQNITEVNVCGDHNILNTKKSLKQNFFVGNQRKAYVFSKLPSDATYWEILRKHNKKSAEQELRKVFFKATLWEIKPDGAVVSLGFPESLQPNFTSTVKDCVEGAAKSIGGNCTHLAVTEREDCCSEKFMGPTIQWSVQGKKFSLLYSPDPSVQLRIPDEKSSRFCHVAESIQF